MGRALRLDMTKYGSREGMGLGTGIALRDPPQSHTPGTPLPLPRTTCYTARSRHHGLNRVVGLISVGQLSLSVRFSEIEGITEVYNLLDIGRIINHFVIVGNK